MRPGLVTINFIILVPGNSANSDTAVTTASTIFRFKIHGSIMSLGDRSPRISKFRSRTTGIPVGLSYRRRAEGVNLTQSPESQKLRLGITHALSLGSEVQPQRPSQDLNQGRITTVKAYHPLLSQAKSDWVAVLSCLSRFPCRDLLTSRLWLRSGGAEKRRSREVEEVRG